MALAWAGATARCSACASRIIRGCSVRARRGIANHSEHISADGLYFTASLQHYYEEMRLMVTSPFPPEIGEVVRVERLTDGRVGVAVRFLWQ